MIDLFELMQELTKRHGAGVKVHAEYDYIVMYGTPVLEINATWRVDGDEMCCQWKLMPDHAEKATAIGLIESMEAIDGAEV